MPNIPLELSLADILPPNILEREGLRHLPSVFQESVRQGLKRRVWFCPWERDVPRLRVVSLGRIYALERGRKGG